MKRVKTVPVTRFQVCCAGMSMNPRGARASLHGQSSHSLRTRIRLDLFRVFLASWLIAVCSGHSDTPPWAEKEAGGNVPILAWHSIPEGDLSPERFAELAGMGINRSLMGYSREGNLKALDLAHAAGVRLLVGDRRFHQGGTSLLEAVGDYRAHPALEGYLLRDEPSLGSFPELARTRDQLKAADPAHWSYVNLLPTYASPAQLGTETYLGHVRRFLLEFRPEVLSFDHYPILEGDRLRADFYLNLELVRQASLEFRRPFWAFVLSCPHRPYPMPTKPHVRLQAWSNFAYGAKGLQYFTYWTPQPGAWDFHDAPIRIDGTRSPTYDLLKEFNLDVQACAEIILSGQVVCVYHSDPLPAGTRGIDASSPFRKVDGGEVLVSLHLLPDGRRYAQVVNRSITTTAPLKLELEEWVAGISWEHKVGGVEFNGVREGVAALELEPGAGAFLRLMVR